MFLKELLIRLSSFWFFYRWHPEVAIRYLPIVDEIQALGKNAKVLDVGSGGLGIAPYLKRVVTGLDKHFNKPFYNDLIQKKGSVLAIPFHNRSFDVVISVDMIEHVSKFERQMAIHEMMRVAKRKVIIAVPCGAFSQKQDEDLDLQYKKVFGNSYHFLDEQVSFGLPQKEEIVAMIKLSSTKQRKKIHLRVSGNENLNLRKFLMRGWITKSKITDIIFRKIFLLLIPVFRILTKEPYYRMIFSVDIT